MQPLDKPNYCIKTPNYSSGGGDKGDIQKLPLNSP